MFRIGREALLEALARVEPGRSTKNLLEQSSCYCFQDGWVVTFNDEICCRTKTGLPAEFTGAVPGKQLKEWLDALSEDEVEIDFAENELKLRAKRKRAGLRLEPEIHLPIDVVEVPDRWTPIENPESYGKAIKQVCAAAGTNQEEFLALCVHVHPERLEATDRYEVCRYEIASPVAESFLVRAKSLVHLAQLGPTKMGLTPNWVHYRNKALIVSLRRQLETFFDLDAHLDFDGEPVELPRGAEEAARLGRVMTQDDKDSNKVVVTLMPGRMRVRGQGSHGWSEGDAECGYDGPEVTFRISPEVLENLVVTHQRCEIAAEGNTKRLKVRGDKWVYVTALGSDSVTAEAPADESESEYDEAE